MPETWVMKRGVGSAPNSPVMSKRMPIAEEEDNHIAASTEGDGNAVMSISATVPMIMMPPPSAVVALSPPLGPVSLPPSQARMATSKYATMPKK